MRTRLLSVFLCLSLAVLSLCGCAGADTKRQVVLNAGFADDEVFKLEDYSCYLPEVLLYLANARNQYESVYGPDIWDTSVEGMTLRESVKENVLAHISQVKAMNILARENGVALNEAELDAIEKASEEYFSSLTETEVESLSITPELIRQMYTEYALANKVYNEIIKDIDPEISDDEARMVTVLHIFIEAGTPNSYDRAQMVHALATDGEHDFRELAMQYSDGGISEASFSKGDLEPELSEVTFNLGNGEISDVIATASGYHIIQCLSTFNREETDLNKIRISEQEKEEVFGRNYDSFAETLTKYLNEPLWESITLTTEPGITTQSFFEVYKKYL